MDYALTHGKTWLEVFAASSVASADPSPILRMVRLLISRLVVERAANTSPDNFQQKYGTTYVDGYSTEGKLAFDIVENAV